MSKNYNIQNKFKEVQETSCVANKIVKMASQFMTINDASTTIAKTLDNRLFIRKNSQIAPGH